MSVSDIVGEIDGLRDRTRRASFSGAVPLALLGLLVAFAAPFYAAAWNDSHFQNEGTFSLGDLQQRRPPFLTRLFDLQPGGPQNERVVAYWLVGVPVAFLLIAAYYGWRARRTGISLNGWRVAITGAAVLFALVVVVEVPGHWLQAGWTVEELQVGNFVNPLLVVAAGVLAIAWVERSRAVLAVAAVFLLGLAAFDVKILTDGGSVTPWDNIQSVGTATLALAGWLLLAAGVLAVVAVVRRRRA
jgi:hypothetical protein